MGSRSIMYGFRNYTFPTIRSDRSTTYFQYDGNLGPTAGMWPRTIGGDYGWRKYGAAESYSITSNPRAVESDADATEETTKKKGKPKNVLGLVVDTSQTKQAEMQGDGDDSGCMLHDIGEFCHFCGGVLAESRPVKFGGKPAEEAPKKQARFDISKVFYAIDSSADVFTHWLSGLGMPPPKPQTQTSSGPVDSGLGMTEYCEMCGRDFSTLSTYAGPGHCVECRYRWLDEYRVKEAKAAGVVVKSKSKSNKGAKKSRYDWSKLRVCGDRMR